MITYEVAHIREQGVDLIIIPLDSFFGFKTPIEQQRIVADLQKCATAAGLIGTVIPVWDAGGGQMAFLAPSNWHSFLSSIDLSFVASNVNRKLTCG